MDSIAELIERILGATVSVFDVLVPRKISIDEGFIELQHASSKNQPKFDVDISYVDPDNKRIEIKQVIKPFSILGIPKNSTSSNIRSKFREKINIEDRKKRALVCLAYAMAMAYAEKQLPPYFREEDHDEPSYRFNAASPLIWVLTGFSKALRTQSESNRAMKNTGSLINESLLYTAVRSNMQDVVELLFELGCFVNGYKNKSSPLHAAAYFGHRSLVSYLIKSGADLNIRNQANNTPMDETDSQASRDAMSALARQPLPAFIHSVVQANGMGEVQHIRYHGRVVAYRMEKTMDEQHRIYVVNNCYVAWHGTRERHILSIIQHGLRKPGEAAGTTAVAIPPGHIRRGVPLHGVEDWSHAVFLTKAVKYACNAVYSDRIESPTHGEGAFCVLVEAAARPGTFVEYPSTTPSFRPRRGDDPRGLVEMRVDPDTQTALESEAEASRGSVAVQLARVENAENVEVTAITLVSASFIESTTISQDELHALLRGG